MRVTFIQAAVGKKPGQRYIGTWKMEPLTIATLAALTPDGIDTTMFDDRIELIDYDVPTDIVAMSVETYTALRVYDIAERFRSRGVTVVLGGYHTTLAPQEASEHADAIVTGNAEAVWPALLEDYRRGALRRRYDGQPGYAPVHPRRDVYAGRRYLPITLAEVGRGCGHRCDFCAIAGYYGPAYHPRDRDAITAELAASPHRFHFIVDDNVVARRTHAMGWMKAIEPLGLTWAGQGTLTMARDTALLEQMYRSGCRIILIGFESLNAANLDQMGKSWEEALGERDELVRRIHDAGLGIYATFVFGFDYDDDRAFADTVEFSLRHKFYTAAFNHLLPYPGTPTYARMRSEGRLLYDRWWLERSYHYGDLAFRPATMSPERMSERCRSARREFARTGHVASRGLAALKRSGLPHWWVYWLMNLRLGEEIDQKMHVPLAGNLDELPK